MNRNRKKAAAATLAAGMAVVLGAGTVMAAAQTGDNSVQKEETVLPSFCYSMKQSINS